jgi:hypothetical protein
MNYDYNKLFYICHLSLFFIMFSCFFFQCVSLFSTVYGSLLCFIFFSVLSCFSLFFSTLFLRVLMSPLCFFLFSIVFQVLSPVYIVLLNAFNCFNFNVFMVFSSEMFIAFHFFKCCSLYLIDFPGFYVSLCTSQCFHFFKVVHCLFLAGFCLCSKYIFKYNCRYLKYFAIFVWSF